MNVSVSQTALAKAIENEASAKASFDSATAAIRTAQAARDALIADAASGKAVRAQDIRAAEERTRQAEIDSEIAAQIHSTAITLREKAQIARWHEEAAELQTAIDTATDARMSAGAAVDEAMNAVRALLEAHKDAGVRFWDSIIAAKHFNGNREARRKTNATMRTRIAIEGPADPFVHNVPKVQPAALGAFLYPAGGPGEFASSIASAKIL